jgi:hypothetical protein
MKHDGDRTMFRNKVFRSIRDLSSRRDNLEKVATQEHTPDERLSTIIKHMIHEHFHSPPRQIVYCPHFKISIVVPDLNPVFEKKSLFDGECLRREPMVKKQLGPTFENLLSRSIQGT